MIKYIKLLFLIVAFAPYTKSLLAQEKKQITVSGIVYDIDSRKPVAGASLLTGTPSKVVGFTNSDGEFKIRIFEGQSIRFMHVGMNAYSQIFTAKDSGIVKVYLTSGSNTLKDVVTVGFKQVTRATMTGASTIISGKDIQDNPVSNVTELLQGRVAGLNVQVNNGMPGSRTLMQMRGVSSAGITGTGANAFLTPTSPLFVVDGVRVDDNDYSYGFDQASPGISPIAAIPPEDIEKIEVLKDAQATALYGSKGAYGVILITTKRGNSSIPIVQYTGNYFVNTIPKLRDVIGGKDERRLRINQIMQYDSTYAASISLIDNTAFLSDSLSPYYNNSTNWQGQYYRNTNNQEHNVNVSGGNAKFNYKVNMDYYNNKGIVLNTGYDRYALNMNTLLQPNDKFSMLVSLNTYLQKNKIGSGVGLLQTSASQAEQSSSLIPSSAVYSGAALAGQLTRNDNKTANVAGSINIRWSPIRHVSIQTTSSYTGYTENSDNFKPSYINNGVNQTLSYNLTKEDLYSNNILSWVNTYNNVHNFNIYAFSEIEKVYSKANQIKLSNTSNDDIEGPFGNDPTASYGATTSYSDTRTAAFGGSFSYNYAEKYVLDASIRTDGSSTNGPNAGWRQNSSIGLRWNFNKESFLKNANWLDFGSIRGSYGSNVTPTGTIYDAYGKYTTGGGYNNNSTVVNSWSSVPNVNFKPITTTQLDMGTDIGLLHSMISLTYDFYYKRVDNQLLSEQLADVNAFAGLTTNNLSIVDIGHEINLSLRPLKPGGDWDWTFSINGAYNTDKLAYLGGNRMITIYDDNYPMVYKLGSHTFSYLMYNTAGVFATNNDIPKNPATGERLSILNNGTNTYFKAGDPRWTDINGDYVIDSLDRVPVGNPEPKITGGIISYLKWKNFTLNISTSFTLKRDVVNAVLAERFQYFTSPTNMSVLVPINQYNFWLKSGDNARYPNPFDFTDNSIINPYRYNQTLFMENGAYFKINSVTLSYNFDKKFSKRLGITSSRVYVTAANLHTFSGYSGPSPENVTALGYDIDGIYPNSVNYTIGLNIQF